MSGNARWGYRLKLGMAQLAPGQLSESELLKWLGARQWEAIAEQLGVPSGELRSAEGERLYASFLTVDWVAPPGAGLESYGEDQTLVVDHQVSSYGRRFVEGVMQLSAEGKMELDEAGPHATVTLINGLVAREGNNQRLKIREPAGDTAIGGRLSGMPPLLREHAEVQRSGWPSRGEEGVAFGPEQHYTWPIVLESDLNGAGLLYFARYVTITDWATRMHLLSNAGAPMSSGLAACLVTERRRIHYYANAEAHDSVLAVVRAARSPAAPGDSGDSGREARVRLFFEVDLYRAGDRCLLASAAVTRRLLVPRLDSGLVAETSRLLRRWGA